MKNILLLVTMICCCYIISMCLSVPVCIISSMAGYLSKGSNEGSNDDNSMDMWEYISSKIEYYTCIFTHVTTVGGVVGTESGCWNPDGLNLGSGAPCPIGESTDCLSGHCNCSTPWETGDTCYCTNAGELPLLGSGEPCPSGDSTLCVSGHCNCSLGAWTGDTCYCIYDGVSPLLPNGAPCPSGDDNLCQSGDCDCDSGHTGPTCTCDDTSDDFPLIR
jgi:hypothetical protein